MINICIHSSVASWKLSRGKEKYTNKDPPFNIETKMMGGGISLDYLLNIILHLLLGDLLTTILTPIKKKYISSNCSWNYCLPLSYIYIYVYNLIKYQLLQITHTHIVYLYFIIVDGVQDVFNWCSGILCDLW